MVLLKSLFFLILMIALSPSALAQGKVVVFLGDSLTEGFGVDKSDAYPAIVEEMLQKRGMKIEAVNAGFSGSTSASALSRMKWFIKKKPNIVFLALGANDGLRGLSVKEMEKNLRAAIQYGKKNGVRMVLAGMKVPPNYGDEYTRSFESVFPRLAKSESVPFIPFLLEGVAGEAALNQSDGIHPNEKGYKAIAKLVADALEGEL